MSTENEQTQFIDFCPQLYMPENKYFENIANPFYSTTAKAHPANTNHLKRQRPISILEDQMIRKRRRLIVENNFSSRIC